MGFNLLLICAGLVICFGGIYFKKICAGIMGFTWGLAAGEIISLFMLLLSDNSWLLYGSSTEDRSSTLITVMIVIVATVLSVCFDRICATINTFSSSFFLVFIICALFAEDTDALPWCIIISLIFSVSLSIKAYQYYDYAFILLTAFSGALIASFGGVGLFSNMDYSDMFCKILLYDNTKIVFFILLLTIILGCVGFRVQVRRLRQTAAADPYDAGNVGIENRSIFPNLIGLAAEKVSNGLRRMGDTANAYGNEPGGQFKAAWEEVRTEQGRNDLKDEIISNKMLFLAPVLGFILTPIIYKISYSDTLYMVAFWISMIAEAVSVGTLTYVVIAKDIKFNIAYQLPYFIGYIVSNFTYFQYYSIFYAVAACLKFLITWLVVYIVLKLVKRDEMKPLILLATAFVTYYYITDWLAYTYIWFDISGYTIIRLAACIAGGYLAFQYYYGVNIFDFKNGR